MKPRLLREVVPDLSWRHDADPRREALSGLVGAVLVFPQAITFAYLVGLAPEYGLYCAVFTAFVASLFGRSPLVGGPNTALSILLAIAIMPYAGRGSPLYIEYVLLLTLMVGAIQLLLWLMRGAELFRHLSPAAIAGIKHGVGVLLVTSSLEGSLGVSELHMQFFHEKFIAVLAAWSDLVNPYAALISGVTLAGALLLKRHWPRAYIILGVLAGTLVGLGIDLWVGPVASQVELLGRVPFDPLPWRLPNFSHEAFLVMQEMLPSAIAIAVLGLAQSLVIARDLKMQVTPGLSLHREAFAQALSNLVGPLLSGFAGAGSFNRTSVAVEMGARTPLSGLVAAVAVALMAWGAGPFFTHLPLPAIAAVLALVGIGMIRWQEMRALLGNRIDGFVFLITLGTVTFIGLEWGILVAALVSVVFYVARVSRLEFEVSGAGSAERIRVRGNLSYASIDELANHLRAHPQAHTELDLTRVPYCDASSLALIERFGRERAQAGGALTVRRM